MSQYMCKMNHNKVAMQRFFEILSDELKGLTTNEQEEVLKRLLEIYPKLRSDKNGNTVINKNRPKRPAR